MGALTVDWLAKLDRSRLLATCHQDLLGDWYRDPWGWPEINWVATRRPSILEARLRGRGAAASCLVDVPKENFSIRPAVILDPIDRLAYQALVGRASRILIGRLGVSHVVTGVDCPGRGHTRAGTRGTIGSGNVIEGTCRSSRTPMIPR